MYVSTGLQFFAIHPLGIGKI